MKFERYYITALLGRWTLIIDAAEAEDKMFVSLCSPQREALEPE